MNSATEQHVFKFGVAIASFLLVWLRPKEVQLSQRRMFLGGFAPAPLLTIIQGGASGQPQFFTSIYDIVHMTTAGSGWTPNRQKWHSPLWVHNLEIITLARTPYGVSTAVHL